MQQNPLRLSVTTPTRFLYLADQSSGDLATLLGEDKNGRDAKLVTSCALFLAGVDIHRRPLLRRGSTIDDLNDRVLAKLERDAGPRWKLSDPPNDGSVYETRIAPAGARWHRPMPPQD